jgi:hypothetical protein
MSRERTTDPARRDDERLSGTRAETARPLAAGPAAILALQRSAGNQAVARVLQRKEETVVTPGGGDFDSNVRTTMTAVSQGLKINAAAYGVNVLNACAAFEDYAEAKIEALDGQITGEELAGLLVSTALTVIGGKLTERVGDELLKVVAEQVYDAFASKIEEGATAAASNDTDEEALKAAISGITQGARDAGTIAATRATSALDTALEPIFAKSNSGQPLSSEEDDLVATFWNVSPTRMDAELERMTGIPSVPTAGVAQLEIYRALVAAFEREYIVRTASFGEQAAMILADAMPGADRSGSPSGLAGTAAAGAAGERASSIGVSWQDFAKADKSYADAVAAGVQPPSEEEYERVRAEARA